MVDLTTLQNFVHIITHKKKLKLQKIEEDRLLNIVQKIKTIIFSRPVGYITPVSNWNEGKEEEFDQRKLYNMEKIKEEVKQNIEN